MSIESNLETRQLHNDPMSVKTGDIRLEKPQKKISFMENVNETPKDVREELIKSAEPESTTSSRSFSVFGMNFRRETSITIDGETKKQSKKRRATTISTLFMPLDTHRIFAAKMKINK
ncbi:unnamed protein product, partial [Mesorhabditis belari]|uniref:Uncharacterized protein n=1 Tax=Mesorhabditis belari TaxID=2138241 RepID=A0AAF3EM11_9BILA